MEETKTVEGKIRYIEDRRDILRTLIDLANEDPNNPKNSITTVIGKMRISGEEDYVHVSYSGRVEIANRIETYIKMANQDEAMIAVLGFRRKVK